MIVQRWFVRCDGDDCGATFGSLGDYRDEMTAAGAALRAGWQRVRRTKMSGAHFEFLCPACDAREPGKRP